MCVCRDHVNSREIGDNSGNTEVVRVAVQCNHVSNRTCKKCNLCDGVTVVLMYVLVNETVDITLERLIGKMRLVMI